MSTKVKEESLWPQHCADGRNHVLLIKEESSNSMETEVVSSPQYGRENFTFSRKFEKVEKLQPRRYLEHPAVQGPQSDAESAPKMPEKGLDGYNWRKYGQKLVKGNKFIRSYYRCTSPNCEAKKQIERSSDGCKTEMNYLGKHHHPKPQHSHQVICTSQAQVTEKRIVTASETDTEDGGMDHDVMLTEASHQSIVDTSADEVAGAVCCSHNQKDYPPDAKRNRKTEITSSGDNLANRPNNVLRHVVQTLSDVDLVNDGYRWRKYGQKLVKGSPNPRSYYRCSTTGCPAKKHVERAFHDSKFVITTYEGEHAHSMPPRSISQRDTTQVHANMTSKNVESRSKPEERNPVVQEITCGGITS